VTLREPRRSLPLWLCLGGCFVVTFVNPYGLDYWRYILEATGMERPAILEWQTMQGWQILLVGVLGSIWLAGAWLGRASTRVLPETAGLLAASLWAAIDSQRLMNFLLLVLAVYGAAEYRTVLRTVAARLPDAYRTATGHLAGIVTLAGPAILLVVTCVHLVGFSSTGLGYEKYPTGALDWLYRHGAGGRLLSHFNHGSLAIWRLYPHYQVAVDGRYEETYPEETVQLAWTALQPNAPGHDEALARVAPDYILVPGAEWASDFRGGWQTVYADSASAVLARPGLDSYADRTPRPMWAPGF
jgi:predicted small integral membrane protein